VCVCVYVGVCACLCMCVYARASDMHDTTATWDAMFLHVCCTTVKRVGHRRYLLSPIAV